MSDPILQLARSAIRDLKPYTSARSLTASSKGGGGEIFLDANESPWGNFNRYPEPQPSKLRETLASLYGRSTEEVFLGRGTDEAIDTLVRTFCEASRDAILVCPPTYGVYEVAARVQGAGVKVFPTSMEDGFGVSANKLTSAHEPNVKIVFLCSPNNPTGNLIDKETLKDVSRGLRDKAIVVIDEAYIEFSNSQGFSGSFDDYRNVVVLRTLSKAWGLAGVRCGVALAHPTIINLLQKVRAPYPLSTPAVEAAMKALTGEGMGQMEQRAQDIIRARDRLAQKLSELPAVQFVFPSRANFLLIKVKNAGDVMATCRTRGIAIRDRSQDFGLEDCVRVSVGTDGQNTLLLRALSEVPK